MSGVSWWCLRDFGQVWLTGTYDTNFLVKVYIKLRYIAFSYRVLNCVKMPISGGVWIESGLYQAKILRYRLFF